MRKAVIVDIKITIKKVRLPRGKTKSFPWGLPFEKMAREILPPNYALSLVICGDTLSQRINKEWRKKTYKPNVLSFPITKHEGEIFLNVRKAAREAKTLKIAHTTRIAHLFVHGCTHLKGLDHGSKMDAVETRVLKKFGLFDPALFPSK